MPAIQADQRTQRSRSQRSPCVDALLGAAWAWDDDDEHEAGASPAHGELEGDPGPSAR